MAQQVEHNFKSDRGPSIYQPVVLNKDAISLKASMPAEVRREASGIYSPSFHQSTEGKNSEYVDVSLNLCTECHLLR